MRLPLDLALRNALSTDEPTEKRRTMKNRRSLSAQPGTNQRIQQTQILLNLRESLNPLRRD
jgi:hypothetical protein